MYPELLKGSTIGLHRDVSGLAFDIFRLYASNPAQLRNDKQKLPYLIKDLDALIIYLNKVFEINKYDYRLYITTAYLENMLTYISGRPFNTELSNRILSILEKAQFISATNPNVYWTMAQTKVWQGDFVGAEQVYRQSINLDPRLPSSYNLLLKFAQITGNQKVFNEIMTKAKENIPGYELK
jgi:tetratricopeptide (TPR) repeat protein